MFSQRRGMLRMITIAMAILIIAVGVYGFAASNNVPETGAGDGSGTISGYDVTGVSYELEGSGDTDPSTIEEVSFNLAASSGAGEPSDIQAQIVTGGLWYDCSTAEVDGLPSVYTCPVSPSVTVLSADLLRVVAAE